MGLPRASRWHLVAEGSRQGRNGWARWSWAWPGALAYAKHKARQGVAEVRRSRLRAAGSVVFALGLVGVGLAQILGADLPFMNLASAILMIGSGLVLVGTVVHARLTHGRHEAETPRG